MIVDDAETGEEESEEKTELVKVNEESEDELTVLGNAESGVRKRQRDSLMDSLLSDDDVEISGI